MAAIMTPGAGDSAADPLQAPAADPTMDNEMDPDIDPRQGSRMHLGREAHSVFSSTADAVAQERMQGAAEEQKQTEGVDLPRGLGKQYASWLDAFGLPGLLGFVRVPCMKKRK